ncbi:MAG TPA: hypothetical protein PLB01_12855 [Thermoanaerobaculia bacterium]|nr:hypothetical protein [Thermoanaerobaculia bacterium]
MRLRTPLLSFLFAAGSALGNAPAGFGLEVLVDGAARPEYPARGTVYVEALRGRDFSLRITNPLGVRVAVALSVDGLNTIDAKHTTARDARKWILDPYQTVVIPGWQVSGDTSRKFYFTGEKRSYGAQLGQTSNLGTIEAVFFREKQPYRTGFWGGRKEEEKNSANERRKDAADAGSPEPQAGASRDLSKQSPAPSSVSSLSDELAATGIGRRTRFDVTRVDVDLEDAPAMSVRLRYEFRPQLVALGVLREPRDPVARREAGRGFSDFCPEPN